MKKLLAVVIVGIYMMGSGLVFAKEMKGECQMSPDNKMERKKEDWSAKRLERMTKELNLTKEQIDKITVIFKENDVKVKTVMDQAKEEMKIIREDCEKQVKAVLTPEQAQKHDKMKSEMQKKMGEGRGKGKMEMKEKGSHEDGSTMMEKK